MWTIGVSVRKVASVVIAIALTGAACAGSPPEVPVRADGTTDPELQIGRDVYTEHCKSCHGANGDRRSDSDLTTLDSDDIDSLVDIVADGLRRMPAYSSILTDEQIDGVIRYSTEVL